LVEETEINNLENKVLELVNNDEALASMSVKVKEATISNATEIIYNSVMKLLEN
jgi:UDP-N-acetylglucosamine:LPS N-acetylglucosamine transferase